MPKPFSTHEKDLLNQRLLDQGYKLFSAYGLKKTSVEELAQAASISKGAFYNFYPSKEALFMAVIEQSEIRLRQQILAAIDQPGPSPRLRLFAVLKQAFTLFETIPLLRFFTSSDFDLLFRRLPPEKLQQHLANDRAFFEELVARCQSSGVPIRLPSDQIVALLYPLVFSLLHQDELSRGAFRGSLDLLLELVAAACLGEVEFQHQDPPAPPLVPEKGD